MNETGKPAAQSGLTTVNAAAKRPGSDRVTAVIHHDVQPGMAARYEQWLKKIIPVAAAFPGHLGVSILRPAAGTGSYVVTLRFDAMRAAQHWFDSGERARLMEEVQPLLADEENVETRTGIEFWFDAPEQRRAPAWKQFMLTLSVILPLTMIVPWVLSLLVPFAPLLGRYLVSHVLVAALIVALMTYVIMPRLTRLAAGWLYRQGTGRAHV